MWWWPLCFSRINAKITENATLTNKKNCHIIIYLTDYDNYLSFYTKLTESNGCNPLFFSHLMKNLSQHFCSLLSNIGASIDIPAEMHLQSQTILLQLIDFQMDAQALRVPNVRHSLTPNNYGLKVSSRRLSSKLLF